MDNRSIGFFDSGLGGLTCIEPILNELENERIIYFGDTARTPYGSKAVSTINRFSLEACEFLVSKNVKMIVIACNTVSAISVDILKNRFKDIPVIGIIEPTARHIAEVEDIKNVGIMGTKGTINSGAYRKTIHKLNKEVNISEVSCPAIVPLIEEDIVDNDIMELTVGYYLDHFILDNRVKNLVLGCTHYPLIAHIISRRFPDLNLINPSLIVADDIKKKLRDLDMLADDNNSGYNEFYASDLSDNFINMINKIFKYENNKIEFKNLDLKF